MPAPIAPAIPYHSETRPRPIADSSFDSPDCCGCERELDFFLPVLLEALWRFDALLRLREGEEARVAMWPG